MRGLAELRVVGGSAPRDLPSPGRRVATWAWDRGTLLASLAVVTCLRVFSRNGRGTSHSAAGVRTNLTPMSTVVFDPAPRPEPVEAPPVREASAPAPDAAVPRPWTSLVEVGGRDRQELDAPEQRRARVSAWWRTDERRIGTIPKGANWPLSGLY